MRFLTGLLVLLLLTVAACQDEPMEPTNPVTDVNLEVFPYDPQPYALDIPPGFPPMEIPVDNPLTVDGVELGRFLFYDPILSKDSTQACVSCHFPSSAFTDNLPVSFGVEGIPGNRSAMSLENVAFFTKGLFWDGRVQTLEEQALHPIEDPLEMNTTWEVVEERLQRSELYQEMFRKAFGINQVSEINRDLATKAIAQFERILVSPGYSKFDRKFLRNDNDVDFTDEEFAGFDMYFDIPGSPLPDAQCFHCHDAPLFSNNEYFNNGVQEVETLNDFDDPGLGAITGNLIDNGKFRAPSLRNIALTAPYMHDGRFQTLEEVIDFYNEGVHFAENLDENLVIQPMGLTEQMKADMLAFLHTLTDTTFIHNPAFQNPFEE